MIAGGGAWLPGARFTGPPNRRSEMLMSNECSHLGSIRACPVAAMARFARKGGL